jgi:hypothetical protein
MGQVLMPTPVWTRRSLGLLVVLGLAACSDGSGGAAKDAGAERDSNIEVDASDELEADASTADAGSELLVPCLDRPDDLSRAPAGKLPCELLPPGFKR